MLSAEFEAKHAEDLVRIRQLCLMDDDFMNIVFQDIPCAELLLQVILQREDLKVEQVESQVEVKSLHGRSVRLDIWARDEAGQVYNIEVQRKDQGAVPRRARYNSSLIDSYITKPGEAYEDLNETYVIFITEHDVLGHHLPIYHIERTIQETGLLFEDGAHIIYVNGQSKDDTALGRLMHDFFCTNADEMYYPTLAKRVRYFKEEEKGADDMSGVLEDMRREAELKGERKGKQEMAREVVYSLLATKAMSYEEIAKHVKVFSVEEIKAMDADKSA